MSDRASSLPIRTQADGADERLHSKIVDFSDPGGADKQVEVSEKLAHVRAFGNDPAGVKRQLKLSELGNVNSDGVYDATNNTKPSEQGIIGHTRNVAPSEADLTKRVTAVQDSGGTVRALDISLHDEAGEPYSATNPMPVSFEESEGTEVLDYQTSVAVASSASVNHDYTVTALKTLLGSKAWATASGKLKLELKLETAAGSGVFNNKYVAFNSTSNPNVDIPLEKIVKQVAGAKVRLTITNLDNQAQDLYSTLLGVER